MRTSRYYVYVYLTPDRYPYLVGYCNDRVVEHHTFPNQSALGITKADTVGVFDNVDDAREAFLEAKAIVYAGEYPRELTGADL